MTRGRLPEFILALVVQFLLSRLLKMAGPSRPSPARQRERDDAASRPTTPAPPRRGPLMLFMLACFVLGVPLMVLFEFTLTRVLGVGMMFAFIVSGVFLVAAPGFLAQEEQ